MLKVSQNPPMRPPRHESVACMEGRWWVAHTRSRFEKAFAWDLAARGIAYFLPMVQRVRLSGGRRRRVFLPLFPSYVFFCGGDKDRYSAMATNRLCRTLDVADQAAPSNRHMLCLVAPVRQACPAYGGCVPRSPATRISVNCLPPRSRPRKIRHVTLPNTPAEGDFP